MTIAERIEFYLDDDSGTRLPGSVRLRDSGVEVWALVAQLPAYRGDATRLAEAYDVPVEAVEAALAYYGRHKHLIDAQIALNTA